MHAISDICGGCVSSSLWGFSFFMFQHHFVDPVQHSKFMTLNWFCKDVLRVMQSIPKPHNHRGTACFFAVLKPQNSWQSIRCRCVCQRSEESLLADIMANQLNSAPPRRRGRHRGIVVVSVAFQAESLKSSLHNPLLNVSSTGKVEIVCTVETWMSFWRQRQAEMIGIQQLPGVFYLFQDL